MWLGAEYQPPHNSRGPGSRAPIRPWPVGMWSTAMQGHSEVKVTGGYRAERIRHRIARNGVRGLLLIPDNRDTVGRHGNWLRRSGLPGWNIIHSGQQGRRGQPHEGREHGLSHIGAQGHRGIGVGKACGTGRACGVVKAGRAGRAGGVGGAGKAGRAGRAGRAGG